MLLGLIVYLPSLRGMYNWDDSLWITDNPTVTEWRGLPAIWTRPMVQPSYPLTVTTFWLEYRLWGEGPTDAQGLKRPWGYHVTNTLLHLFSGVLLYVLLCRLKLPGGTFGAWLAAAIYLVHPVNVESVAWIVERKNVLAQVLFFGALLFAARFFALTVEPRPAHRWRDYAWALGLFFVSLFAKTTTCIFPIILLILLWWRYGRVTRRQGLQLIPFFALALGLGLVATRMEHEGNAMGPEWNFSLVQRTVIAGRAFWFYLAKLVWPDPICQVYPRWSYDAQDVAHRTALANPLDWIYPLAVVALFAALFALRRKISRGPCAALAYFLVAVGPALGFLSYYTQLYTFVADHYQYLAMPAIVVLLVETLLQGLRRLQPAYLEPEFKLQRWGLVAVLLTPLAILSFIEANRYSDDLALWQHTVDVNPNSFIAWDVLGCCKDNRGDSQGARKAFETAIRLAPNEWGGYAYMRGWCLERGDTNGVAYYERLAREKTPASVVIRQALYDYRRAQLLEPQKLPPSQALLVAERLDDAGKLPEALVYFVRAQQDLPQEPALPRAIADLLIRMGRPQDAPEWLEKARRLAGGSSATAPAPH